MARIERHDSKSQEANFSQPPKAGLPQSVIHLAEEISPIGEKTIRSLGKAQTQRQAQNLAKNHDISYPSTVK